MNLPYRQPFNGRIVQGNLRRPSRTFSELNHSPCRDLPRRVMNRDA